MNPSPLFRETREDVLYDLVRAHPFATLVTQQTEELAADHLPFVRVSENGSNRLEGHLAASNALIRSGISQTNALVVFQGPDAYVTPSWYASKAEHGKVVPTWNYAVVHVRGHLTVRRDTDWLLAHLHRLTDSHESHRDESWAVSDAPDDFVARQLKGLAGVEIEIEEISGVWKFSQNKSEADKSGVEMGLRAEESSKALQVADLVRNSGTT